MQAQRTAIAAIVVGIALVVGCHPHKHSHSNDASPDAADEIEPVVHTVWSGDHELFIEHPPVIVGTAQRWICHVSRISPSIPRKAGSLEIQGEGPDGARLDHTQPAPKRDGVYLPELTFPSAGRWKIIMSFQEGENRIQIELGTIDAHPSATAARANAPPGSSDGITYLKEEQWRLGMLSARATKKRLTARRRYAGRVRAPSGSRVSLSAPAAGRLLRREDGRILREGDGVAAGEVIALLEPTLAAEDLLTLEVRLAEAEAEVLRGGARLNRAKKLLDRTSRLAGLDAKSKQDLEDAQFGFESAAAELGAAKAIRERYEQARRKANAFSLRSDDGGLPAVELRSPLSGTLVALHHVPGERLTSGELVCEILDSSSVWIEAFVPESDASRLPNSPGAYVTTGRQPRETTALELTHVHTDVEVDERRTVGFVYRAANSEGRLRIGMSVEVLIAEQDIADAIVLPRSSLVEEDGGFVVFVQVSGETYEKRKVEIGADGGAEVQILSGVVEGERVAASFAWSVRLAGLSNTIPTHHH